MLSVTKFCFGLSLKQGTIIIGVSQSILSFMLLILSAAYAENPHELVEMSDKSIIPDLTILRGILIGIAVASAVQCVFSIMLIFGAETNRPLLLLPWLVLNPILITAYVLLTSAAIFSHNTLNNIPFVLTNLFMSSILVGVATYKFLSVYGFYKYLKGLNF